MTSDVHAMWDRLVAGTSAAGDPSLTHLLPGRERAEVASTLADTMGIEPDEEALDWLTLHDGPAGGSVPPTLAGASWVVASFDHLLVRYGESRTFSIEIAPDFDVDESAVWLPQHFPIAVWGSAQLAFDMSGAPRLWAVYPDGGPAQADTYPSLLGFLDLLVRFVETRVYVWDGARWGRDPDVLPRDLERMRL